MDKKKIYITSNKNIDIKNTNKVDLMWLENETNMELFVKLCEARRRPEDDMIFVMAEANKAIEIIANTACNGNKLAVLFTLCSKIGIL